MEHVVFFPAADGAPSFRRVSSLDEAVTFVEHLRNVEAVTEFSVQALTPVPLEFRAYYRVEVPAADAHVPAQSLGHSEVAPLATPSAAIDEDRSAEWVAAAAVVEAPAAAPAAAVVTSPFEVPAVPNTPFAVAPPVTPTGAETFVADAVPPAETFVADAVPAAEPVLDADVLPDPDAVPGSGGRRTMGFFSR